MIRFLCVLLLPVFLIACSKTEPADLVLLGTVHTANPSQPVAEGVAVRGGRILDVGDETDLLAYIGEGTRVVHIEDGAIYPGFTDSHMHLRGVGERELMLNLEGVTGIDELRQRLAAEIAARQPGEWIHGRGWIETHWKPRRFPTREDLDEVSPMNPVVLVRADGHALVANSRALALAGIDRDTEAPFGGEILRDKNGEPTGMLVDHAMTLVTRVMQPGRVDAAEALITGARRSAELGWTSVQNAGTDWTEAMLLRRLVADGRIRIRIYNAVEGPGENAGKLLREGPVVGLYDGRFTLRGIKVSIDGALGSRGAALLEPYADADTRGLITERAEDLLPMYRTALQKGVQVETHAIGDRANRFVLDLYEQAFREVPAEKRRLAEPRWRIEHAQILAAEDIPRFARLGIIPSMQFSHAIGDLHFAPARLGESRLAGAYAWRSLLDTGIMIAGGTDAPVEKGDPRIEFYAAVARRDLDGYQDAGWHPEQALSREEALRSLTLWPAYAAFEEGERGTIEPGKRADFTIYGEDLMIVPLERIPEVPLFMTVVGGEIVYRNPELHETD